jgi:hypothetical protein
MILLKTGIAGSLGEYLSIIGKEAKEKLSCMFSVLFRIQNPPFLF